MENQKLGQEPAFACTYEMKISGQNKLCYHEGMSKRFYAACAAMQGFIVGVRGSGDGINTAELIQASFNMADELLKQEDL